MIAARRRRAGAWLAPLLAAMALLALLAGACEAARTPLADHFDVQEPVTLAVVVDDGEVTVVAGAPGAVIVAGDYDADRHHYTGTREGGTVRLELRRTRSLVTLLRRGGASLKVTVPPGTRLDMSASNGAVGVAGPLGGGRLATSNGAVSVRAIDGALAVTTSNGAVRVEAQRGDLSISTSNGSVTVLDHAGGSVAVSSSNGRVEYGGTIERGSRNDLATSNGSLLLTLTGEVSTELDAATSNGSVASRYAVLDAERSASRLRGRISAGGSTLRLRTSNGSIELR